MRGVASLTGRRRMAPRLHLELPSAPSGRRDVMAFATPTPEEPTEGGLKSKIARYWYPREYLLGAAFLAALGIGGFWGTWENLCAGEACPSIAQVRVLEHEQTSKVFAADGRLISRAGPGAENARLHPCFAASRGPGRHRDRGSEVLRARRFRSARHRPRRMGRADVPQPRGREHDHAAARPQHVRRQSDSSAGIVRKLKEVQIALDLERAYTKDQILEYYMNEIWMGRVVTASRPPRAATSARI